jgi:hypothetical protein
MRTLALSLVAVALFILAPIPVLAAHPLAAQQTGAPIDLPAGARAVLQVKGEGVQIYTCTDANGGLKWVFKAPDAKLLNASGQEIGSHFAGPTWKLADGSQVQGQLVASMPAPQADSVAWLLLRAKHGTATGTFANVAFIRRTETHGGAAPEIRLPSLRRRRQNGADPLQRHLHILRGKVIVTRPAQSSGPSQPRCTTPAPEWVRKADSSGPSR